MPGCGLCGVGSVVLYELTVWLFGMVGGVFWVVCFGWSVGSVVLCELTVWLFGMILFPIST